MIGFALLVGIGLFAGGMATLFSAGGLGKGRNLSVGVGSSLVVGLLFQAYGVGLTGWDEFPVILTSFGLAFVVAVVTLVVVGLVTK